VVTNGFLNLNNLRWGWSSWRLIQTIEIKIKQIFARNKLSFAITEEANNIYGWGKNTNKIISKNINNEYVGLPTLIILRL
jgi:alpha-tubulin suppressor-like RCC1 family protein